MILTLAELCDKAANYLQSIKIGNKNTTYSPEGSLKAGTTLKTYSFNIQCPAYIDSTNPAAYTGKVTRTVQLNIKTNENIPSVYLKAVSDSGIVADWNDFKDRYIYSKLNSNTYVSLSSMFLFLYLFRYFVDTRFCQFTDIYTKSSVWLYKTGSVAYAPSNLGLAGNSVIDKAIMDTYINTLVSEIVQRDTLKTLKASSSSNSCSSSSSSSSCSSSSSSSSRTSSSSSSSSLFIAYFNMG